jgi:hypothetical protein
MIDINVFCNCESYGLKCIYVIFKNIYFNENDITWMFGIWHWFKFYYKMFNIVPKFCE